MTRPTPAFGRLYPDIVRAGSFGALVDQMFWTLGSELRSEPNASWHRVDVVADARVGSLETGTESRSFDVRIRQNDAERVLLAGGRTDRLWQAVSAMRSILEQQDRAVSELTGPYRFLDLERTQVSVRAGVTEGRGSPGPTEAAGGRRAAPPRLDLVREPPPEPPADAELTPEELRLLGWLADDRDTSEMARSLGCPSIRSASIFGGCSRSSARPVAGLGRHHRLGRDAAFRQPRLRPHDDAPISRGVRGLRLRSPVSELRMASVDVPETRFARAPDGAYIAYQVVGDGPPLVYLPGDWSSTEISWQTPLDSSFLVALASFCRLIMVDRRGTGRSDALPDEHSVPFDVQVGDVEAVLDATETPVASVFGAFDAGPLSLLFAGAHHDRTHALILYAPYARGTWAPDYPWAWTDEEFRADLERIERGIASGWSEDDYFGSWLEEIAPSLVDDPTARPWLNRYFALSHGPTAAFARLRLEHGVDARPVLSMIRVPTLVLNRREDRMADFEEGRWIAQQIPGASFVELEGIDHPPWVGDAEAILRAISGFLGVRYEGQVADRVLATVLFTDIVGSTERLAALGDARWKEVRASHDEIARRAIERHRGRFLESTGDGILATLDGPALAIRCANAMGDELRSIGIEIRAGVHTGEVELVDAGVRGMTVHIGARVAALAGPGEILASQTVKDLAAGSGLVFEDAGVHTLKGVPDRWRLYRVVG